MRSDKTVRAEAHGPRKFHDWAGSAVGRLTAAALLLAMLTGPGSAGDRTKFRSPEVALEQGLGAYRQGLHPLAEQAFTYAAEHGNLLARYYLARLYADPGSAITNHTKAFDLVTGIVREHAARIDVDDDPRARYVGKSLTMVAGYWLRGLESHGIRPNPEKAAGFLQEAATFFRDHDAQFELAKLYLTGEGVQADSRQAMHWLSTLSQIGHPGAQAFLADLYWRGKYVERDERKALALITLAVENAPSHERIWIEDIYQSIYCGMSSSVRQQSEGLVASFRQRYAPRPGSEPQETLGGIAAAPVRTCADGSPLPQRSGQRAERGEGAIAHTKGSTPPAGMLQGRMLGVGVRQ